MTNIFVRGLAATIAAAALSPTLASAQIQRALGLDISAWQGNISQGTWNNFRNVENRQFVFLRASRGGTTGYYNQSNASNTNPPGQNTFSQRYDDPYFVQNINRATTAGMYAGSYHFSRPDIIASTLNSNGIPNSGADEADHFIQMAGAWMRPGYLFPVHDLEAGDGARPDTEMAQFVIDFSNRIYNVMGIRPATYTNGNYAANVLGGGTAAQRSDIVTNNPVLWSARWPNQADPNSIDVQNGEPKDSYTPIYGPWDDYGVTHPWKFWQYASTGRLPSFNNGGSNLDFDVARGGVEYLEDQLIPALWMTDVSGSWSTLTNWNSGKTPTAPVTGPGQVAPVGTQTLPTPRLPGAAGSGVTSGQNDTVILDRGAANPTITLSSGSHNIRKLFAREEFNITGGSLNINYTPSTDSTPISAQFSAAVSLTGGASLSVNRLQVDATRTFTVDGGNLTFKQIDLMPGSTPAKILLNDDVSFTGLGGAEATIANGAGSGSAGRIDLGGAPRTITVADGAAPVDLTIGVPVINGTLTKAGAGTLALAGANTYAGDTIVQQGTLRLTSAVLANAADVFLAPGTTLDLGFSGSPDVIDSLFVDGVSKDAGVWGAVGSGAQFTSPLITGAGRLQVNTFIPPPMPSDFNDDGNVDAADLAQWQTAYGLAAGSGLDPEVLHSMGDADGDTDIDGNDFLTWQQQADHQSPAPVAAVPEPAGALPLACALAGILRRRRR